jgi:hypothetical protein
LNAKGQGRVFVKLVHHDFRERWKPKCADPIGHIVTQRPVYQPIHKHPFAKHFGNQQDAKHPKGKCDKGVVGAFWHGTFFDQRAQDKQLNYSRKTNFRLRFLASEKSKAALPVLH